MYPIRSTKTLSLIHRGISHKLRFHVNAALSTRISFGKVYSIGNTKLCY